MSTGATRYDAYAELTAARGLAVEPELARFGEAFTELEGARALAELLDGPADFTAVIAGNDMMALGCYEALAERGLRCPQDISVVGFNDMHFADRFAPPLTTVRIPHHEMGRRAAEQLLAQIDGSGAGGERRIVLPAELVVRSSSAPAPRRRGRLRR